MGPIFNEKIDKNKICGSVNSARMYCSQKNWSKIAATVHVPYMNSSRKWGENAWKKKKEKEKKKKGKRRTETQQTQSKHTQRVCLDKTYFAETENLLLKSL